MRTLISFLAVLSTLAALPVAAQDLIRSDLPLWTGNGKDRLWPHHFSDGDGFGCSSPIAFGDWKSTSADDPDDVLWMRIGNYGAFHCAYIVETSDATPPAWAPFEYAFLVELAPKPSDGDRRLFILQSGVRGGSQYTLLAARKGGIVRKFDVLDAACPKSWIRDAGPIDVFLTRYCAAPSASALADLARAAAKKPPVGVLELVKEDE